MRRLRGSGEIVLLLCQGENLTEHTFYVFQSVAAMTPELVAVEGQVKEYAAMAKRKHSGTQ